MKHVIASRLVQAGLAAVPAAALLWLMNKSGIVLSRQSDDFMPHGYCYLWNPWIVWLHVISDGLITLSYYAIPVILVYFIRKNKDFSFNGIFWMFGGFILACGTTHFMEIWNVWHGNYLLAGVLKAATAGISVVTAIALIPLAPKAVSLPGLQAVNHRLEQQIAERQQAEGARDRLLKELADQKFALDQHAIVATTDVQGTITYVNDKFCAISKYSRQEVVGQNHRILNSRHHPKEFFQQMYHNIANGKVWRGEICNRAKDGSIYWVDTTVVPFLDAYGKPRQYMAIRADITERKRVEEVRERLAAIVECSDDAIIGKDLNGVITAWNRGAEKVFGYSSAEALGKPARILLPTERGNEESDILARIQKGESVEHFETKRVRKDGTHIDVSVTISPVRDSSGAIVGAAKIARDITERKQSEDRLTRQAEALSRQSEELLRSQQALETQTLMLQSVLDSMAEGLVAADETGKFILWNPAATGLLAWARRTSPSENGTHTTAFTCLTPLHLFLLNKIPWSAPYAARSARPRCSCGMLNSIRALGLKSAAAP